MTPNQLITIGEFVAHDFRTAAIFSKYGIDYASRGNRTVAEVCEDRSLGHETLLDELTAVMISTNNNAIDFSSWPLDLLIDYVEKKHHRYIEKKLPIILQYLEKLCQMHSGVHPELIEIQSLFEAMAADLTLHLKKEKLILFPFIVQLEKAVTSGCRLETPLFDTIENPIAVMKNEHEDEGERLRKIRILSHHYCPPADACNNYHIAYAMLRDFDQDLHEHVHIENNILFPAAIILEGKLHQYQC